MLAAPVAGASENGHNAVAIFQEEKGYGSGTLNQSFAIGYRGSKSMPKAIKPLEFGPLLTLAEDYFFSSGSGQTVSVAAMELVR